MMMLITHHCGGIDWWRANLHINSPNPNCLALRQFINPSCNPDGAGLGFGSSSGSVICFRDDNSPYVESPLEREASAILSLRGNSELRYSPWASSMLKGFEMREDSGGPNGGGNGGCDDDGGGGGGGGDGEGDDDGEGDEHIYLLPLLTLTFAAFHLGYCIAVWGKDEKDKGGDDNEFLRMGLGLFCLLVLAAFRLNNHTGNDAYILGLGASIGVMVWTGERCFVKGESNPAAVVALFAASMAVMFTAALYHNI